MQLARVEFGTVPNKAVENNKTFESNDVCNNIRRCNMHVCVY